MTIRIATEVDWKAIQALNLQIFEYELQFEPSSNLAFPYTAEAVDYFNTAAAGRKNHVAFVYEERDEVIGYAIVKLIPPEDLAHRVGIRLAQLHTFGVDKAHRGVGIGKQLIAAARKWALANGANRLKVVAYAGNVVARSLYRSVGFHEFEVGYEMEIAKV